MNNRIFIVCLLGSMVAACSGGEGSTLLIPPGSAHIVEEVGGSPPVPFDDTGGHEATGGSIVQGIGGESATGGESAGIGGELVGAGGFDSLDGIGGEISTGGADLGTGGESPTGGETSAGGAEPEGTGGELGTGGETMAGGAPGVGGAGVGGEPVCVPDATMCNSICGVIPDGCGGEMNCGGCAPTAVSSMTGNVCDTSICTSVVLPPHDTRLPAHDAECAATHGADYGEAWRGWGSGTSCTNLVGTDVLCCEPAEQCHAVTTATCSTKLYNCSSPPIAGCAQVIKDGRLKNEWCCD